MMHTPVEIVIVSYGRLDILEQTLVQLRRLYPDTQLCLGLQGDIRGATFLDSLQSEPQTRVLRRDEPSVTRTLNACIRSSTAELLLLLDDDALPCPGWVEAHTEAFRQDSDLVYTSGREVRLRRGHSLGSTLMRMLAETVLTLGVPREAKCLGRPVGWAVRSGFVFGNFDLPGTAVINSARGCNMALRRQAFLDLGGFNETFRGNAWGFETEFGLRAQAVGHLGRYVGDAVVLHQEAARGGTRSQRDEAYLQDFRHNQQLVQRYFGFFAYPGCWLRIWRVTRDLQRSFRAKASK